MGSLNVGHKFETYKALKKALKRFQQEQKIKLKKVRSKTLESSNLKGPFPEGLKYKEIYYECIGNSDENE